MKLVNIPVSIVAVGLSATISTAAMMSATGVVKAVDTKHDSITLTDGKVYVLGEGFEAETFKIGEKVSIKFEKRNGKMVASSVNAVK
jgi:Cu/Ag efflux protein CusF